MTRLAGFHPVGETRWRLPVANQSAACDGANQFPHCHRLANYSFFRRCEVEIAHLLILVINRLPILLTTFLVGGLALLDARAQVPRSTARPFARPFARPQPRPTPAMKRANELIRPQDPINVSPRLLDQLSPDNSHVRVSLSKQRAYLMMGDQIVVDSPISSGKRARPTPQGRFHVLEKDKNHKSSLYGDFVDSSGRIVRRGVSSRIDSAPSGTHYVGADMKWFMRLTDEGVGMHVGFLPGYPASHGCIRMPSVTAEMFYNHVKVGTPVVVGD